MSSSLATRHRHPELMDQPGLAEPAHAAALAGLARVNSLSRAANTLWQPLAQRMRSDPSRHWRLLDVACGAGDVPISLARRATSAGFSLSVAGCDMSETAVTHAARRADAARVPAEFFQQDVLADGLPAGFDFVTCSLFLHHLDPPDAIKLLRAIGSAAGTLGLVSDLRRTRTGYALAWLGTRILSRSPIVHTDGPLSVRGAFTMKEAMQLATDAGLAPRTHIRPAWPQRFLLTIEAMPPIHT